MVTEADASPSIRRSRALMRMMSELLKAEGTDEILSRLVVHLVPDFADWCLVNVVTPEGLMRRLCDARAIPAEKSRIIDEIRRRFSPSPKAPFGLAKVINTGVPSLSGPLTEDELRQVSDDPDYLRLWTALDIQSYVAVPIVVRSKVIGGLALDSLTKGRVYTQDDLVFAGEIAALMGLAIERTMLTQEAATLTKLKDEFLATLSHELRTPLAAILGWTQLLLGEDCGQELDKRQALLTIERNAKLQCALVDDILDLSQVNCAQLRIDREPVDLVALVEEAVASARPALSAKRLAITSILEVERAACMGDRRRLLQVLGNILNNAIKFTQQSGQIKVKLAQHGNTFRVTVEDDGIGITPDFLPFVFDKFRQADGSIARSFGGLGLGLALAKQLVELHGGRIAATSDGAGRGAAITIDLPAS